MRTRLVWDADAAASIRALPALSGRRQQCRAASNVFWPLLVALSAAVSGCITMPPAPPPSPIPLSSAIQAVKDSLREVNFNAGAAGLKYCKKPTPVKVTAIGVTVHLETVATREVDGSLKIGAIGTGFAKATFGVDRDLVRSLSNVVEVDLDGKEFVPKGPAKAIADKPPLAKAIEQALIDLANAPSAPPCLTAQKLRVVQTFSMTESTAEEVEIAVVVFDADLKTIQSAGFVHWVQVELTIEDFPAFH